MRFLETVGISTLPLKVEILPQDTEDICSEILGENKARVRMIWPQQCCDSNEGQEAGKWDLEKYGT